MKLGFDKLRRRTQSSSSSSSSKNQNEHPHHNRHHTESIMRDSDTDIETAIIDNNDHNGRQPHVGQVLPPNSVYRLQVDDIHGNVFDMSKLYGMVTLIVNVACS
jgi:hypothetical protein